MGGILTVGKGYDPLYLARTVAPGAENLYLDAAHAYGEPPGLWSGPGAEELGLRAGSEVDPAVMEELYGDFLDPRDPAFRNSAVPREAKARLGRKPATYASFDALLEAKLAAEPEASPERREQLRIEARREERKALQFLDLTFSADKTVTLLHAGLLALAQEAEASGDAERAERARRAAREVEDALKEGAAVAMEETRRLAGWARAGRHGKKVNGQSTGRWIPAGGWVVASFLQHTSRNGDPQLHVHQAVLNRQSCEDGVWRSLDGQAVFRVRAQASAVGERALMERLTRTLGTEWVPRPDGQGWSLTGVAPEQVAEFSTRRREVTHRLSQLVADYRDKHGFEPDARALFRMAQQANKDTKARKTKLSQAPTRKAEIAAWERRAVRAELGPLADVPGRVLGRRDARRRERDAAELAEVEIGRVLDAAIADAQKAKAAFTRYDLARHISRHLPSHLGGLEPEQVSRLLSELADEALSPAGGRALLLDVADVVDVPDALRHRGVSVFRDPTAQLWTTPEHLDREERFLRTAAERVAPAAEASDAAIRLRWSPGAEKAPEEGHAHGLTSDQAAAVYGVLTSERRIDVLEGYAGTGKSYTIARAADLWREMTGAKVTGLAVAQNAAQVLAAEGMDDAWNTTRWLQEVESGAVRVERGQLLVVDEASMVTTDHMSRIAEIARRSGAKILLTGDSEQLSAPGAGGLMRQLVADQGSFELTGVRRFHAAWERDASVRLREGDVRALADYDLRGRLRGGTREEMERGARDAYIADHLSGRTSLLLAATNAKASELSGSVRAELVGYGLVDDTRTVVLRDGNRMGVGDLVMARRNDRTVRVGGGERRLSNRDVLRVESIEADGTVVARLVGDTGRAGGYATLTADYVRQHVELGYAGTVHAAQGRTVDTCHSVVEAGMSRQMFYVEMTRGREGNWAWTVVENEGADLRPFEPARPAPGVRDEDVDRDPLAVLAGVLGNAQGDRTAVGVLRAEADRVTHLAHLGAMWGEVVADDTATWAERRLPRLLPPAIHDRLEADPAREALVERLHRARLAGLDPDAVLRAAVDDERGWEGARSIALILTARVDDLIGSPAPLDGTWAERTPRLSDPAMGAFARQVAEAMDARTQRLGEMAAEEPPAWLVEHLGSPPEDVLGRAAWAHRAGLVLGYREQYGDERVTTDVLGAAPGRHRPERRAAWERAALALGLSSVDREAAAATTGQLWERRAAYARELASAPPYAAEDLRATVVEAQDRAAEAERLWARARACADPAERESLSTWARANADLADLADRRRGHLERAHGRREEWMRAAEPIREAALAADAELRRRFPGVHLPPLDPVTPSDADADARRLGSADLATARLRDLDPALREAMERAERARAVLVARGRESASDEGPEERARRQARRRPADPGRSAESTEGSERTDASARERRKAGRGRARSGGPADFLEAVRRAQSGRRAGTPGRRRGPSGGDQGSGRTR
ncbi:MobF family relaxase [Nocardiopsis sp. NPDC050513]|uniref:MobF family relaxase n=1 Tax=Nocardiopsis sp. NPDC050513 TaxID=3364338 RepID=UPI00378CBA3F